MDELMELGTESTETELSGAEGETEGAEQEAVGEGAETQTESAEPANAAAIWKQVKDRLKDSPSAYQQVKKALHFMEDANRRMPDGIVKAAERLELLSKLDDVDDPNYVAGATPIEDVISNTLAERSFWRDFDNAFQAGDSKVVNQMIEANPESFQKLVPAAMDRFAEVNPEGFSTYICKSVSGYLNEAQIPLQMALLERVLPAQSDDPSLQTVIDAFKSIKGVFDQIKTTANNQIQPKAIQKQSQQQQEGATGGTSLETREMNVLHDEWLRDIRPRSESFMVSEVQKVAPKTKFTQSEVSSIKSAIREEINARVTANSGYQNKVKAFLKAKNKTGYAMTVESEHKKIIPGAVKRAVDDILAKRKTSLGKKTTQQASTAQNKTSQTIQPSTNNRFESIAQSPTRLGMKVDMRKTSNEMLARNEAYIIGRTNPVKWKR